MIKKLMLKFLFGILCCFQIVQAQNWQALGSGMENLVMVVSSAPGDSILAGGRFYTAGGKSRSYLAVWDGNSWQSLGKNLDNPVKSIANIDGTIYVGGEFSYYGDSIINCFARWDGEKMIGYHQGFFKSGQHAVLATVNAIARYKNQIYVGGIFDYGNSKQDFMYNIARWNNDHWEEVGGGLSGTSGVNSMVVFHDTLYVGGGFNLAGDTTTAKYIAKWDGNKWSPVGRGMNNEVTSLAIYKDQLYAGGVFTQADGKTIANISKWNGSTWEAVGGGINNSVYSLCAIQGRLYAGGYFSKADGNTCNNLAWWDGNSWHTAGNPNGMVWSIADVGYLAVGGNFTNIGGQTANRIAIDKAVVAVATTDAKPEIEMFPNPASTLLNLSIDVDMVDIYSLSGSRILHQEKTPSINVSSLTPGFYMAHVFSKGMSKMYKLQIIP